MGARLAAAVLGVLVLTLAGMPLAAQDPAPTDGAHACLYIEPYIARFECLIRMEEMLPLLGERSATMLPASSQQRLRGKARALASVRGSWLQMKINGRPPGKGDPHLAVSILRGIPGRAERLAPDEDIMVAQSMVAFVWDEEYTDLPETIAVEWRGFTKGMPRVLLAISAGGQKANRVLTAASPATTWKNGGRVNLRLPLVEVPPAPSPYRLFVPLGSLLWVLCGAIFILRQRRRGRHGQTRTLTAWLIIILGAVVLWPVFAFSMVAPWSPSRPLSPEQAERILKALLRNTYRAFDQRQEPAIYDVLERSVQGPLLEKIYLQTLQSLQLDLHDGARIQVTDLEVTVDGVRMLRGRAGFVVNGQWTALGTVGHWGHEHRRVNQYTAELTVEPVDHAWKLTGVEVREEKRL